ncbi:unnamed protein product [Dibothriocephalus latus]|uniref:Uncharacterized protein n=1 Tax=Dibothriocephalus latus TaxID=60516 RepID=A0A3P7MFR0_DIBLA|nr:unnamed protein product [Dibothriocephalus latus]
MSTATASTCRQTILPLATTTTTTTIRGQELRGPPLTAENPFFPPGRQPLGGVIGGEKRSTDSNRILSPTEVATNHSLIAAVTATPNTCDNCRTDIPGSYTAVNGDCSAGSTTDCVFNRRDPSCKGSSISYTPSTTSTTEPVSPDSQKHPYLGVAGPRLWFLILSFTGNVQVPEGQILS